MEWGVITSNMLRYRIEGSGLPLLLIHGWGVTYKIWKNLMPLLMSHFQLIMIELPGVGSSPEVDPDKAYYPGCAEAIEAVRQKLGIEQWAILAYSSGTRAGEAYMQRYPQHVNRAVFLCPVYLTTFCSLGLRFEGWLENSRPGLANWLLSDWRLYGLVLALGFNGRRHDYTDEWVDEIGLQPLCNLKRMLYELPGKGRSPFAVSAVPTLFVWGRRDVLTDRPYRRRFNDVFIPANHSAPMLAAPCVAQIAIPFLAEGKLIPRKSHLKQWYRAQRKALAYTYECTHLFRLIRKVSHRRLISRRNTFHGV